MTFNTKQKLNPKMPSKADMSVDPFKGSSKVMGFDVTDAKGAEVGREGPGPADGGHTTSVAMADDPQAQNLKKEWQKARFGD